MRVAETTKDVEIAMAALDHSPSSLVRVVIRQLIWCFNGMAMVIYVDATFTDIEAYNCHKH